VFLAFYLGIIIITALLKLCLLPDTMLIDCITSTEKNSHLVKSCRTAAPAFVVIAEIRCLSKIILVDSYVER